MQLKRLWRSLVTYGAVAALAIQFFGAFSPSLAHAATPTLRLNEINWAGSQGHATDEWIELQNVSGATISFASTPYTLQEVVNGTPQTIATLDAADGFLPDGYFLILTREATPSSNSTLLGASSNAIYIQKPTLDLPDHATAYRLLDSTSTLTDSIDDAGQGIPFAGSLGSGTEPIASMSRVTPLNDGNLPSSWYTTHTMGTNFVLNSPEQFATPAANNVEVPVVTNVAIAPTDSTDTAMLPVITGSASAGIASVTATFTRASFTPLPYSRTYTVNPSAGSFTVTPGADLAPGRYMIDLSAFDADGNRSATVHVMVAPDTTETNYVILPTSSALPTPTIDPTHPTVTNRLAVPITGAVDNTFNTYNSIEILRNGRYFATIPLHADGRTFGGTIDLLPNMDNTIQFVAVDIFGTLSLPGDVTITQDSIRPNPVDVAKVVVGANPTGTHDTIAGMPGAAEADTTLWVYADAALTQPIVSAAVAPDGSFPMLSIGDNLYNRVYLVLADAAGNTSTAVSVDNATGYVAGSSQGLNVIVMSIGDTQGTASWNGIVGAASYHVKYKLVGGTYGSVMSVCPNGNSNCPFKFTFTGLQPHTAYTVAVAVVDRFGNESAYVENSFTTKEAAKAVVTTTTVAGGSSATDNIQKSTATPTPAPTASATPEKGDVKSAATDTARNWTPWIILLILIGIAILATAGYFYWFGGEAGEAAMASAMHDEDVAAMDKSEPVVRKTTTRRTDSPPTKKPDKDKRW